MIQFLLPAVMRRHPTDKQKQLRSLGRRALGCFFRPLVRSNKAGRPMVAAMTAIQVTNDFSIHRRYL